MVLAATAIAGVAVLVLAGGLMASNMGFKLNLPILALGGGSASGTNYIALPYNPQVGMTTARHLYEDMVLTGGVTSIQKHDKATDGFIIYNVTGGTFPPNGWTLAAGEAYIVKALANQNYIVVGSHNPGLTISFVGPGGGSASGTNYYAHPYHGVAANARELFGEIGGSVVTIQKHDKATDSFIIYNITGGTFPPNGWNLAPGEGYIVKVLSDQDIVPAHY
jgi:hypothetical protein